MDEFSFLHKSLEKIAEKYDALDATEDVVKELAHKELAELLDGKTIVKEIYVKNKIFNIVVK